MYFPPPPPPPSGRGERSFSKAILVTLATTVFGLSLMLNVYLLLLSGLAGGDGSSKTEVLKAGDPTQKVAVVPVGGIIMDEESDEFDRVMQRVERDAGVKALVIQVDTPGGDVTSSDEMYNRVLQFKAKRPGTPVVVSMGSLATSGGYYLACAGDTVFAQPTTLTANIGVLMPRYNLSELADKWGVRDTTLKSTGAEYKDAGSMLKPENPRDTAYMQGIIDAAFVRFKEVVKAGRGKQIAAKSQTVDAVADGKVLVAADAVAKGLVDQVGYLEDAVKFAATAAGLTKETVVKFEERATLMDLFSAKAGVGTPGASGTTVNGVNVNVDREFVRALLTPRVMYLWTGN